MQKLSAAEIPIRLKKLDRWDWDGDSIKKDWVFSDFRAALQFINLVGDLAEDNNHHPEIMNTYNRVSLKLSTHDVGGLTERDFILAAKIDKLGQ